jgi:hypothetical protein
MLTTHQICPVCLYTTDDTSLSPRSTEPKNPRTGAATAATVTHSPALLRPSMTSPATAAIKALASATPTMHSPRPARPVPPAPSKQPATTSDVTTAVDTAERQPVTEACKTAMLTDTGDSSDGLPGGSGVVEGSVTVLNSSHKPSNTAKSKQSTDAATDITASGSGSGVGESAHTSAAAQVAHEKQAADSDAVMNTTTAIAEQSNIGDAMDIDNAEDRYVCNVILYIFDQLGVPILV